MNLSKTLNFSNNILLILIILLSFISIIINNTVFIYGFDLFNKEIQPESIVILISSSILLLLNLILTKFIKNKLLIVIINLILAVSLIVTSIYLFISLQKINPPQLAPNYIPTKSIEQILILVNQYQKIFDDSNKRIYNLTKTYNETKINLDNFDKLQKDLEQYKQDLPNAQDAYNLNPIESNNLLITNIQDKINKIIDELNNIKYYYNVINARTFINSDLNTLQGTINNENFALKAKTRNLNYIKDDFKYVQYINNYNNIKVVKGLSYSFATLSIISGILIGLITLMK